jgi:hypothetical protein
MHPICRWPAQASSAARFGTLAGCRIDAFTVSRVGGVAGSATLKEDAFRRDERKVYMSHFEPSGRSQCDQRQNPILPCLSLMEMHVTSAYQGGDHGVEGSLIFPA